MKKDKPIHLAAPVTRGLSIAITDRSTTPSVSAGLTVRNCPSPEAVKVLIASLFNCAARNGWTYSQTLDFLDRQNPPPRKGDPK